MKKSKPTKKRRTTKKPGRASQILGSWYYSWDDLQNQLDRIEQTVKKILSATAQIITKENVMAVSLDAITAEVARNTTVTQSVLQLVKNLADQIAAIPPSNDPATQAALDALKDTLANNDQAIADAVTANTPAAPAQARKR